MTIRWSGWRARRGSTLAEFALVMPVVAAAAVFVADIGTAAYRNMTLKSAARAGAEYVLRTRDIQGVAAVVASAANRDRAGIGVTVSEFCTCGGAPMTCGSGSCTVPEETFMSISVREQYTPLIAQDDTRWLEAQATFRLR